MPARRCPPVRRSAVSDVTTSIDTATRRSDDWAARVINVGVAVTNLSVYLAESANKYPDARALVSGETTRSYSALGNDVARFADYLIDGGLQPGDRVGVMLPNGSDFAAVSTVSCMPAAS
jgi:non-ribosomal peptide synthetase component E (peptide arylation enzyme)